jgi:hypothetical protein
VLLLRQRQLLLLLLLLKALGTIHMWMGPRPALRL